MKPSLYFGLIVSAVVAWSINFSSSRDATEKVARWIHEFDYTLMRHKVHLLWEAASKAVSDIVNESSESRSTEWSLSKEEDGEEKEEEPEIAATQADGANSEVVTMTTKPVRILQGAELGRSLLKVGDPSGAEAACTTAAFRADGGGEDVEAWTCLGEARMALYEGAWKQRASRVFTSATTTSKEPERYLKRRLLNSCRSFETAVRIDPTYPEARLGLGLCLFLIGSRGGADVDSDGAVVEDASFPFLSVEFPDQILFDSILHFNAAVALASSSITTLQTSGAADGSTTAMEEVYVAALYNSALAYLALGDSASAIAPLQKSANLVRQKNENQHGIVLPTVNLGAVLLQRGTPSETIALTNGSYCKDYQQPTTTSTTAVIDGDPFEFDNRYYDTQENSRQKARAIKSCSILTNNLAVAKEAMEREEENRCIIQAENDGGKRCDKRCLEGSYTLAVGYEHALGLGTGALAATNGAMFESQRDVALEALPFQSLEKEERDEIDAELQGLETAGGVREETHDRDKAQTIGGVGEETYEDDEEVDPLMLSDLMDAEAVEKTDSNFPPSLSSSSLASLKSSKEDNAVSDANAFFRVGLDALEKALSKDPSRARTWLSLSRLKLRSGDRSGAVTAGAKALEVAVGGEEIEASTAALEEALEYLPLQGGRRNEMGERNDNNGNLQERVPPEVNHHDMLPTTDSIDKDMKMLYLERELLDIKLKLLQHSSPPIIDHAPLGSLQGKTLYERQKDSLENMSQDEELQIDKDGEKPLRAIGDIDSEDSSTESVVVGSDEDTIDEGAANETIAPLAQAAIKEIGIEETSHKISTESTNNKDTVDDDVVDENAAVENAVDADEETVDEDIVIQDVAVAKELFSSLSEDQKVVEEEEKIVEKELNIPPLYRPLLTETLEDVPPIAMSYMKLADAYFDKSNFKMASKQFLKVIKKAPNHIPAHLGYAASFERWANTKQIKDVAMAYVRVAKIALSLGEERLAETTYERALVLIVKIDHDGKSGGKESRQTLEALQQLSLISFTPKLAANTYYEIGMRLLKGGNTTNTSSIEDAVAAFRISNSFVEMDEMKDAEVHAKSAFQLGKLTLDIGGEARDALAHFDAAIKGDLSDEVMTEALVLSGKAKEILDDVPGAIDNYKRAIDIPKTKSTSAAHYYLGLALKKKDGDAADIKSHIELSLNLGMDPTPEAIEILGEDHVSVIRGINRVEFKQYKETTETTAGNSGRGGIMGGGTESVTKSESIFLPQQDNDKTQFSGDSGETLSIIEQGAVSFNGRTPSGQEIVNAGEETVASAARQQSSARNKAQGV